MLKLFINIKELLQIRDSNVKKVSGTEMANLPLIKNAFLLVENDIIIDFGKMESAPKLDCTIIDCKDQIILPTWCDSHTHLVFGEDRHKEFIDRIKGLSYEEIAKKGGGILNSAKKLQKYSKKDLYNNAVIRLKEVIKLGTGAIEIKSGYGLSVDGELKMLKVIKRLKENFNIPIKATFLGAHAFPFKYKENHSDYIDLIINEMLPKISKEKLADYIDVFCEKGYFNKFETDRILKAGKSFGLTPKIHVNQFNSIGGIQTAIENNALSVDHLEIMTNDDIKLLEKSNTIPVALPSCSFFLGIPYTPAREIIDANLPLAIASDFNPGSSPSGNMNFVVSSACIKLKMTPEEAINSATINGAYAMGVSKEVGSITRGKKANFIITNKIPSYGFIPYAFGSNLIDSVYLNGEKN